MTKLEELARKIAEEIDERSKEVTPHHELSIREYADVAQSQIETALKPLLDACEAVAKHTAPYDRSLNWKQVDQEIAVLREQLSQWRSRP